MAVDVLIVGSGLAGAAAAIEATAAGAEVALISAGRSSSHRAQGGIAAAVGEGDSVELHARDTLAAGGFTGDPAVVAAITAAGPEMVAWLAQAGIAFDPGLGLEGGHSRSRILHSGGDASGRRMMAALSRSAAMLAQQTARLSSLLVDAEGVAGAVVTHHGVESRVAARATVLATGGYAGLFARSTNAALADGSGILAAHGAGAELADLDLVQFHPTVYAGPGRPFLATEALRGAGATIVDAAGERFVDELAPRDVVAAAIERRIRSSGEACVWLDARHLGTGLRTCFPGFVARCGRVGLDPSRDLVPIAPAAHYCMGGIVTDLQGRTTVPHLWAAGECAWTGMHGRNRLASNSLLEAAVLGRWAGRSAAAAARSRKLDRSSQPATREAFRRGRLRLVDIQGALEAAGVDRDASRLEGALQRLSAGRGSSPRSESARALATMVFGAALDRLAQAGSAPKASCPLAGEVTAKPRDGAAQPVSAAQRQKPAIVPTV